MPSRRGTYHAFTPAERAPQLGDIIVQDRRDGITAAQVSKLETLAAGVITHGDIVVEVQPRFVVAIGGNVGDSARKRRYPLGARSAAGDRSRAALHAGRQRGCAARPPVAFESAAGRP